MTWIIGIIVFFAIMKKFNNKFTDIKKIIPILLVVFLIRGIGIFQFGSGEFEDIFESILNAVIILAVIRIISIKFRENTEKEDSQNKTKDKKLPNNPWQVFEEITEHFDTKSNSKPEEEFEEPAVQKVMEIKQTTSSHARKIGEDAIFLYLTRRNYKYSIAKDKDFDFTAYDYQKRQSQVKLITFEHDKKENVIELSEETYQKALNLGRNFMLFVVSGTSEDDSSDYLGNYVKVYKVDSILADIEFIQVGNSYKISLAKLSRHSSDWETNIK